VVTNIVGILIILVIVAGLRIKNAPIKEAEEQAVRNAAVSLETELAIEGSLRTDVTKTVEQIRNLQQEAAKRSRERTLLATGVAALEQELKTARQQLDTESQNSFDLQRQVADAQREQDELERERLAREADKPEPILVENYPTPIGKKVDEDELHFQLRAGRIAHVPLDRLVERFKADAQQKAYRLLEFPELTETIGPEGGFRLRYTLERREVPVETQIATGRGAYAQMKRWTLIPVAATLGETLEAALADGSQFRRALSQHRPDRTTVTIWTYPDSFAEFRQIKKELFHQGFATAGRPLPDGVPISASPEGTKSAAE
jgi:hypothetical protein